LSVYGFTWHTYSPHGQFQVSSVTPGIRVGQAHIEGNNYIAVVLKRKKGACILEIPTEMLVVEMTRCLRFSLK